MEYTKPTEISSIRILSERCIRYFMFDTSDSKGLNRMVHNSFNRAMEKHITIISKFFTEASHLSHPYSISDRGLPSGSPIGLLNGNEFATKSAMTQEDMNIKKQIKELKDVIKLGKKIKRLRHRFFFRTMGFEDYNEEISKKLTSLEIHINGGLYKANSLEELIEVITHNAETRIFQLKQSKKSFVLVSKDELELRYNAHQAECKESLERIIKVCQEELNALKQKKENCSRELDIDTRIAELEKRIAKFSLELMSIPSSDERAKFLASIHQTGVKKGKGRFIKSDKDQQGVNQQRKKLKTSNINETH